MAPRDEFPRSSPDDLDPLEELVAACLEVDARERETAVESACRDHPEYAAGLRARIQVLEAMGIVERPTQDGDGFPEQLGEFRLLHQLGGGGMGVVYLAVQTPLGRDVALKLIRPEHLFFPGARARFRREAEAVARLQHPGIVPIYTVGETDGVPYFAMEHVPGCTLAEALSALEGRAPERLTGRDLFEVVVAASGSEPPRFEGSTYDGSWVRTCVRIVHQVAGALEHAHRRGVLHRDVKPSNVMLTPDGRALLLDFGLTSSLGDARLTRTGSQVGTLYYMSPEHVTAAGDLDQRADVYSLGVTLYELLSLQLPHRGADPLATQRAILEGRPDALRPRNRKVEPDLETVCLTAIDRDAGRRYASAEAFALDLENVLTHRPIQARPPGVWLRTVRWAQRRPALATAAALSSLLALGLPSALLAQQSRHNRVLEGNLESLREEAQVSADLMHLFFGLFGEAAQRQVDGEPITAAGLLELGSDLARERFAEDPARRARALLALGISYGDLRDNASAAELLALAEEAAREIPAGTLGRESTLGIVLMKLAEALSATGDDPAALPKIDEALELFVEHWPAGPSEHEPAARLIQAKIRLRLGEVDAALASCRELLGRRRAEGEQYEGQLASTLGVVGSELCKARRYDEAEPLLREALALADQGALKLADRISLLVNLGVTLKAGGELDEAGELYDRARELALGLWGPDDLNLAILTFNCARLHEARGDHARAAEGLREAARVAAQHLPAGHGSRVKMEARLGIVLCALGSWEEALEQLDDALPRLRATPSSDPLDQALATLATGLCAEALGDPERGAEEIGAGLELLAAHPAPGESWIRRGRQALARLGESEDR